MKCEDCDGTGVVERSVGGDGYGGRCSALADVECECIMCDGTGYDPITDDEIRELKDEAAAVGDEPMVHCCFVALGERDPGFGGQVWPETQDAARAACEEALENKLAAEVA